MGTLQDVTRLMDQAVERDPVVLSARTRIEADKPVPLEQQIDLCFSIFGGQRAAIQLLAREIDEAKGIGAE